MESETRRKIEETVAEILSHANLEETTEFEVRLAASQRLGFDLSSPETKSLVRNAVESFLLSKPESSRKAREPTTEIADKHNRLVCKLSDKRNLTVHDYKGNTMVSIREYYRKDGKQHPTSKGISMPAEQWSTFKQNVPAIEEAIRKMELKLRHEHDGKEISRTTLVYDGKETEDVPTLIADVVVKPHEFHTEVDRFDGKNYKCWEKQMDILLKKLDVAYVLHEPCPIGPTSPEASTKETAQLRNVKQKWKNDDHTCSRNILHSLSDHLFGLYSKKTMTAKELWEEMRLIHLFEEFGTKRSQVKKYIEFQMVEERSIPEQVNEINEIADSIVAGGMILEEKFHVSVVISKLPPSWKDVCVKLMCEEYLPFWMLMNRLGVEEELRKGKRRQADPEVDHPPDNDVSQMGFQKPGSFRPKKRDFSMDNVVVCRACGKRGHTTPHCRSKTWRRDKGFSDKRSRNNGSVAATTENGFASEATNS